MKNYLVNTQFGALIAHIEDEALTRLAFANPNENASHLPSLTWDALVKLPRKAHFQTKFQERLFQVVQAIPRGETRTYGQLADQLHSSPRAVASAISKNPLAILIPCHRVVKSDGTLGGYFGTRPDMLNIKAELLRLEQN
jgi:O-6-methylguanine DNA methyltransferase